MAHTPRRALALIAVAFPLLLLADLRPVEATCGGGGGGGMGGGSSSSSGAGSGTEVVYNCNFAMSLGDAITKATEGQKGILLYFQPENAKDVHPLFRTKMMQEISDEHLVVRLTYAKDHPLRMELKVPKELHVIHACDWHANSLKAFQATVQQKFPLPSIEAVLKALRQTVKALNKKYEGYLKTAEEKFAKGDAPGALKAMGDLVDYKGHPVAEQAKPLIKSIEEAAGKEIAEALKVEDKKARAAALQKVKTRYKNLKSIEDRCAREIEAATGMIPPPETDSALVRREAEELVDAMLASIDDTKRAPSLTERAYQAMCDGLRCEIREEYDKALEHYAMAAGIDPRDSVALTYLGELYRHHLGRWSEAKKLFERVVELNNNNLATAVALHGLGKMTIWEGNNERGLKLFEESLKKHPTALCYRNLAVFWNTENDFRKAFGYATQAFDLDPNEPYNQVFYSIYLLLDGQKEKGEELIKKAQFDPSMSYNYACYHAAKGNHEMVMKYLHRHFYGYEKYDDVRRFEMAEARMDIHFKQYKEDPRFLELTALAAK